MTVFLFTVTKKTVIKVTIAPDNEYREYYDTDLALAEAEVGDLLAGGGGDLFIDCVEILEEDEDTKVEVLEI